MSAQEGLVERLLRLNACEQGCSGRCKECPDDVAREAAARITSLESELAEARAALALAQPLYSRRELESELTQVRNHNATLRGALTIARECVVESFDFVDQWEGDKRDHQLLAQARLDQIEAALAGHGQAAPTMTAEQMREACVKAIPDNWLDPLLTGPEKKISKSPDAEIQALCVALRARLRSIAASPGKGGGA